MSVDEQKCPLLIVTSLKDDNSKEQIYLPSSICWQASLSDDFTKDTKVMRDIDQYRIKAPQDRFDRINKFMEKLKSVSNLLQ